MKSIWKCRPPGGRHFDVGFINQALLAKVSLLDKVSFCGTVKPQPRPENPTDTMKKMSIMANPIMSGDSLVFLTTAHNRAMSSHVQNRLSTDTYECITIKIHLIFLEVKIEISALLDNPSCPLAPLEVAPPPDSASRCTAARHRALDGARKGLRKEGPSWRLKPPDSRSRAL